MTRICWWLVDRLSLLLARDERDAVRGDFAELTVSGWRALWEVLGLVTRRHAALWTHVRPWLVLLGLAAPLSMVLSLLARWYADGAAVHAFMYVDNWTWGVLESQGARRDLARVIAALTLDCVALLSWSWTTGFAMGSLARRTVWINAAVFAFVLLIEFLAVTPTHHAGHAAVFEQTSYSTVLPLVLRAVVVLAPLLWGAHQGARRGALGLLSTMLIAIVIATLTMRESRSLAFAGTFGWWRLQPGWQVQLLQAVLLLPVGYMLAATAWRRRSRAKPRWLFVAGALLAGCTAISAAQRTPTDYPQWRGRNRDGAASAFVEPGSWPDKLRLRWKVDVGEGYATPLVVGKRVYVFARRDGGEGLIALDAETGSEQWRTSYVAPYTPSRPAAAHGAGPKATPLFHEGKLFTLGVSGIVAAFEAANGALLWRTEAPTEAPWFGAASSAVGDDGVIVVNPGNYGALTAFDSRTGAVKWTAGAGGSFASPLIATFDGVRQVVSITQASVIGVSVKDGELLWEYKWPGGGVGGPSPVLYGDTIIVSALNQGVAAFKPSRSGNAWRTTAVWETKDVSMYVSNPVVIGDTLFGLSHRSSGQFFALDAPTGKVLWLGEPREAANTAIVKAGDLLFLLNDDAELIVARGSRTRFEPLKRYSVADSATWAQPAISGKRLFIRDVSSIALWTLD
jgi:outer membrane protein assembly factor BamB